MNKSILIFDQAESAGGSIARAVDVAIALPAITFFICTVHPLNKLYARKTTANIHEVRLYSFYNYPKKYAHTQVLLDKTSNKYLILLGKKILAFVDLLNEISLTTQLKLKLAGKKIDVVQANAGVHFLPYRIAIIKKSRLIYYFRHLDEYGWAQGKMLEQASHYVFVGKNLMEKFQAGLELDQDKCQVIHSPFNTQERLAEETEISAEDFALFDNNTKLIISIGRICAEKGQHIILEALTKLPKGCPPLKVIFIGQASASPSDKAYEATLHNFIAAHDLTGQVIFLGYRRNPLRLLKYADIAVQAPVYFEALAGSLVEALQLGIPTISADSGGANEVIIHGKTGLLFPSGDSGALAAHIETLISNPALCEQLSANGKQYATEQWDKTTICAKLYKIYESITPVKL